MLFTHAGFDPHAIFTQEAFNWVPAQGIKQVTKHTIGRLSPSWENQPKWLTKAKAKFDLVVSINLTQKELAELFKLPILGNRPSEPKEIYPAFFLLSEPKQESEKGKENRESNEALLLPPNSFCFDLPNKNLLFEDFYQKLFSKAVKYLSTKALNPNIYYEIRSPLSFPTNLQFIRSLEEQGIEKITQNNLPNGTQLIKILFTTTKSFQIKTHSTKYQVQLTKGGLLLSFNDLTRFIPHLAEFSSYHRLIDFLLIELKKQ